MHGGIVLEAGDVLVSRTEVFLQKWPLGLWERRHAQSQSIGAEKASRGEEGASQADVRNESVVTSKLENPDPILLEPLGLPYSSGSHSILARRERTCAAFFPCSSQRPEGGQSENAHCPESELWPGAGPAAAGGVGGGQRVASDATEAGGGGLRGDARGDRAGPAHVSARFKSWRRAGRSAWRRSPASSAPGTQRHCQGPAWSADPRSSGFELRAAKRRDAASSEPPPPAARRTGGRRVPAPAAAAARLLRGHLPW